MAKPKHNLPKLGSLLTPKKKLSAYIKEEDEEKTPLMVYFHPSDIVVLLHFELKKKKMPQYLPKDSLRYGKGTDGAYTQVILTLLYKDKICFSEFHDFSYYPILFDYQKYFELIQ